MLGLIAGNGRFPLLVVQQAVRKGTLLTVAAIREEADPAIEEFADGKIQVHWLGLGRLGRLLKTFKKAGVDRAMMCGQVKHVRIFARDGRPAAGRLSALPDLTMLRVLLSLPRKNTASLIGAFVDVLEKEGIQMIDSTTLVPHLLPEPGVLTKRSPDAEEQEDIHYGLTVARRIAELDVGQTVVVKDQAVVAVEAMEGTDETIRRAAQLAEGRRLTVVKLSRPQQDMRFDVPVLGMSTLKVLGECRVSALAMEAGKTLLLDREDLIRQADEMKLAWLAVKDGEFHAKPQSRKEERKAKK
ncbi:MAG: UDP-2,3-diacylglucosamine diphosphatase LpxI [Acidobacteriota bacterium]